MEGSTGAHIERELLLPALEAARRLFESIPEGQRTDDQRQSMAVIEAAFASGEAILGDGKVELPTGVSGAITTIRYRLEAMRTQHCLSEAAKPSAALAVVADPDPAQSLAVPEKPLRDRIREAIDKCIVKRMDRRMEHYNLYADFNIPRNAVPAVGDAIREYLQEALEGQKSLFILYLITEFWNDLDEKIGGSLNGLYQPEQEVQRKALGERLLIEAVNEGNYVIYERLWGRVCYNYDISDWYSMTHGENAISIGEREKFMKAKLRATLEKL
jgi:hypothetical protein